MALWQKGPQQAGAQVEYPAGIWWEVVKTMKNSTTPPTKGAYFKLVPVVVVDARDARIKELEGTVALLQAQLAPAGSYNAGTRTVDVVLPGAADFEYLITPSKS